MLKSATGHSAIVTMELRTNGECIRLAQLGPDFAIPVDAVDLPPGDGEVVMSVDGEVTRMPVSLSEGSSRSRLRIPLAGR